MISPRLRRLENDYQAIRLRFDGNPYITVEPVGVTPPQSYRVIYKVPSLRLDPQNRPIIVNQTIVNFELPSNYPKEKPHAVATERIFHPNFGDYVCIADFWSPAQSIVDIILEVGEMLQWQKYNILSPLDAVAADWAAKNKDNLPVGHLDLYAGTAAPKIVINVSKD